LVIGPKGGKKYVSSKPRLVTAQWEIESWLEGQIDNGDMEDENDPQATYYFITTKEPNNIAIDSSALRRCGNTVYYAIVEPVDWSPEQTPQRRRRAAKPASPSCTKEKQESRPYAQHR